MNVLYVHRTQGKGVEMVHIMGIVNSLRKMGHTVDIVSPMGVEGENQGRPGKVSPLKWAARFAPEFLFESLELAFNVVLAKKIWAHCRQKKYDLIYERTALMTFAAGMCAQRAGIPLFLEVNFTAYTPLFRKRSRLLLPLARWIDRRNFRIAAHNFAVSGYLKQQLMELSVPENKITVVTNAADPAIFRPDISGAKIRDKHALNDKTVIGFAGGFYPWHGLKLLLQSVARVAEKTDAFRVLLIGDGPERAELEQIVRARRLENLVHFTGTISHDGLPEYIAAFDIGLMPDSNEYGSPMKIYEYMAMGKAVIGADYGPVREGIRHGETGLLFPPGDAEALAGCLLDLISNAEKRKTIGRKGRELVEAERNWFNNARVVVSAFERLNGRKA